MTGRDPGRLAWWSFLLVLAGAAVFVAHAFVGLLALGLFGYYATRPICVRLRSVVGSRRAAAALTVMVVLLPILLVVVLLGLQLFQQLQQVLDGTGGTAVVARVAGVESVPPAARERLIDLARNPASVLGYGGSVRSNLQAVLGAAGALVGTLLLLSLSATLSYTLLANDGTVSAGLVRLFGGRNSTAYRYARAVDADLESVFFGTLLFAIVMSVVATVTYAATNAVAPPGLRVPMVLVLGFLTGVASLVPVVVGKLVYVPVVALLGLQAVGADGDHLPFVGGVLVVYVLVLDLVPQSVVQPYLAGRRLDTVLLLFAYLLGPVLFGWYGIFLMPILLVLLFEAVRVVLPELVAVDLPPEMTAAPDREREEDASERERGDEPPPSTDAPPERETDSDA